MTLHWEHSDAFKETWPSISLEKSLFVIDQNRISCAGGIAPLDLMYTLISEHYGENFARKKVSDWFMHTDVRPSGGPQKSLVFWKGIMSKNLKLLSVVEVMEENHLSNVFITSRNFNYCRYKSKTNK